RADGAESAVGQKTRGARADAALVLHPQRVGPRRRQTPRAGRWRNRRRRDARAAQGGQTLVRQPEPEIQTEPRGESREIRARRRGEIRLQLTAARPAVLGERSAAPKVRLRSRAYLRCSERIEGQPTARGPTEGS